MPKQAHLVLNLLAVLILCVRARSVVGSVDYPLIELDRVYNFTIPLFGSWNCSVAVPLVSLLSSSVRPDVFVTAIPFGSPHSCIPEISVSTALDDTGEEFTNYNPDLNEFMPSTLVPEALDIHSSNTTTTLYISFAAVNQTCSVATSFFFSVDVAKDLESFLVPNTTLTFAVPITTVQLGQTLWYYFEGWQGFNSRLRLEVCSGNDNVLDRVIGSVFFIDDGESALEVIEQTYTCNPTTNEVGARYIAGAGRKKLVFDVCPSTTVSFSSNSAARTYISVQGGFYTFSAALLDTPLVSNFSLIAWEDLRTSPNDTAPGGSSEIDLFLPSKTDVTVRQSPKGGASSAVAMVTVMSAATTVPNITLAYVVPNSAQLFASPAGSEISVSKFQQLRLMDSVCFLAYHWLDVDPDFAVAGTAPSGSLQTDTKSVTLTVSYENKAVQERLFGEKSVKKYGRPVWNVVVANSPFEDVDPAFNISRLDLLFAYNSVAASWKLPTSSSHKHGIEPVGIALIVIGCVLGVAVIMGVAIFYYRRMRRRQPYRPLAEHHHDLTL